MPDGTARGPHAVVTCGSFRTMLEPGATLTFGRSRGHRLRIGHAPEDLRVPRFAGTFECRADGVLVHNRSDKRTLHVQTFPGPGYEVLPLMIAGTHPHPQVKVVVVGQAASYSIIVDTRPLDPAPSSTTTGTRPGAPGDEGRTVGFERIGSMSARHRLMLTALCLPGMTRTGSRAQLPTYAEMEEILRAHGHGYRAKYIRNSLDELRSWLTHEHGIDGLVGTRGNESARSSENFLAPLERWAVHSGNVTDDDLDRLEADDRDGPGRPGGPD